MTKPAAEAPLDLAALRKEYARETLDEREIVGLRLLGLDGHRC